MTTYIVKPTANRKYVRELLKQLPKGFKIGMISEAGSHTKPARPISSTHPCVLTPEGELLRATDGRPVHVANTPGNPKHSLTTDLRSIRHALRDNHP
jgi:hypothetical protein